MEKHGNGGFEDVSKTSKSKIWEHFLLNKSTSMASCNICSKLLKVHGGGTKSMHFHLKAKHSISVPKIMSRSLAQIGRKKNPQTLVPIHGMFMERRNTKKVFSNFSCMFLSSNIFSNFNSNCFNLLNLRNLQEQVKRAFCYQNFF